MNKERLDQLRHSIETLTTAIEKQTSLINSSPEMFLDLAIVLDAASQYLEDKMFDLNLKGE